MREKALQHYLPSLGLFALLAAATLASQGLIVRSFVHDSFFLVDSIWRSHLGEIPHIDFQTPIGQAFYWPYAIVSQLSGGAITDVLSANVLVAAFLLLLGFAVLPARFPPLLLFLALGSILITALTGRSVDQGVFVYDYLAPYNRWGWSFAMLATFIIAIPARDDAAGPRAAKHRKAIDGLCLAIAIGILYYVKLSYFAGIVGLFVCTVLLRVLPRKTALLTLVFLAAFVLLVEIVFGNNLLYIEELRRAAEINMVEGRGVVRVMRAAVFAVMAALFGGAAALLIALHAPFKGVKAWIAVWWRPLAVVALIIAAATAIRIQNHARWEMNMLGAALLVAAEYARRGGFGRGNRQAGEQASTPKWRRAAAAGILLGGVGILPLLDAGSIVAHAAETRASQGCTAPELRGTPMEKLLFPRPGLLESTAAAGAHACSAILREPPGPDYLPYTDEADYRRMLRTVALLREHGRPGQDVVLALEFGNPFPFIFRAPPAKGALIWFDLGRSFSTTIHPDPAMLLEGTDIVVQMDYPVADPAALGTGFLGKLRRRFNLTAPADNALGPGQDAWLVYGAAVRERFIPVARSGEVTIWRRK
jgi:hypothetical protein